MTHLSLPCGISTLVTEYAGAGGWINIADIKQLEQETYKLAEDRDAVFPWYAVYIGNEHYIMFCRFWRGVFWSDILLNLCNT